MHSHGPCPHAVPLSHLLPPECAPRPTHYFQNIKSMKLKRNLTLLALALILGLTAAAQTTLRTQGVPRQVSKAAAAKVLRAAALTSTGIDFDKIQRWAGSGNNRAALAIKWEGTQNSGKTLVWGYRWNDGEEPTGEDLLNAVAKADPSFYLIKQSGTAYGSAIGGYGYDTDGDALVAVADPDGKTQYPRNGIIETGDGYGFDDYTAADADDAWNAGWYSGYWSYWLADNATDQLGFSPVGASGRKLTDGCIDAWVWSSFTGDANEYDGDFNYLPACLDLTQGAFVVNEDWFGHRNSAVNFVSTDGQWSYDHLTDVGATACYGTFYGNRFYAIAKQAKDGNAENEGGRITICDANSLCKIKQIADIDASRANNDGRAFVGVDEHKGYVSTQTGIYVLDLDRMTVLSPVADEAGNAWTSDGSCGSMVRLNDYVYAATQSDGLLVIDPATDRIVERIACEGLGSIAIAKDGSLWVSTTDGISRVDTETFTLTAIELPTGVNAPSQSWYAWTPDGFCASAQRNSLFWTYASGWFGNDVVFRYDIDEGTFTKVIDLASDPDGWHIYGCSFRVDPVTDLLYTSLFKTFGKAEYTVRKYDADGNAVANYPMEDEGRNYWFPGMFVFPDTSDPVASAPEEITVGEGSTLTVDLLNTVADDDNLAAAAVKTVESVADESVATATVRGGSLVVEGVKSGTTSLKLKYNSNGITTTARVKVNVTPTDGISSAADSSNATETARYAADGTRLAAPKAGVNIVKMSDGTTRKTLVRR